MKDTWIKPSSVKLSSAVRPVGSGVPGRDEARELVGEGRAEVEVEAEVEVDAGACVVHVLSSSSTMPPCRRSLAASSA